MGLCIIRHCRLTSGYVRCTNVRSAYKRQPVPHSRRIVHRFRDFPSLCVCVCAYACARACASVYFSLFVCLSVHLSVRLGTFAKLTVLSRLWYWRILEADFEFQRSLVDRERVRQPRFNRRSPASLYSAQWRPAENLWRAQRARGRTKQTVSIRKLFTIANSPPPRRCRALEALR